MAIAQIKAFSEQAKTDPELREKLLAVQKIRELIALGKEYNFELDEVELYPQFSHKKLTCSSMETKASGESVNFSIVA